MTATVERVPTGDPARPHRAASIAVVVVTYHPEPGVLERCLVSVRESDPESPLIVVDNGGDLDANSVRRHTAELIRPGRNRGFGAAANCGIKAALAAGCHAVALINDDVVVEPGWLDPLWAAIAADTRIGAVQPKLLFADTNPPLVNSLGVALGPDGAGVDIGIGTPDGPQFGSGRPIEIFTGGAVLLRREFLTDLGGFDERYFLYYEDVDLALRGTERGWTYRCEPSSVVWHVGGATTSRLGDQLAIYQERNRLWVALRFGSPAVVRRALWLSIRRLRHTPRRAHASALGRAIAGAPQRLIERLRCTGRRCRQR